ncbi:hypothetical protein ACE102_35105 [Bradyrhizobium sp. vgs-9]|uniref:hypothetical protein n=1 Tax=Bradyrhizobium sp. vgs-9 TaxID=208389 RepID=UPI0035D5211E
MPQIWMTYDELATLNGCSADEARMQAMHLSLDRRKSRDGNTRVKLNLALTVREAEFDLDDAITALRDAHRQMSGVLSANQPSLRRGVA